MEVNMGMKSSRFKVIILIVTILLYTVISVSFADHYVGSCPDPDVKKITTCESCVNGGSKPARKVYKEQDYWYSWNTVFHKCDKKTGSWRTTGKGACGVC
jgi:hypothetical protein